MPLPYTNVLGVTSTYARWEARTGEPEGPIKHAPDTWIHGIAILRPTAVEAPELVPNQQRW
jgi:hypothetical protein